MRATVDQALDLIERIDWQRVLLNLRASGLAASTIAGKADMPVKAAQNLARGDSDRPSTLLQAVKLLDIHYERCPERHSMGALRRAL